MGDRAPQFRRTSRRVLAVAAVAAVLSPAVTEHDSFPISTYPMYAFRRDRTDRFPAVLGEGPSGDLRPLPIRVVANTDDPLIAEALVANAIRAGSAVQLCEDIARRVGAGLERLLVVEEVHDVIARAKRAPSLQQRVVHASCEVGE